MSLKILHNNRCSKSRTALKLLEGKGKSPEIIRYLETPLNKPAIKDLLNKLNVPASDIIRKGEAAYKENYKGQELSEDEWIEAMVKYPKLIERPIVIKGDKAVVGRPPENVLKLI